MSSKEPRNMFDGVVCVSPASPQLKTTMMGIQAQLLGSKSLQVQVNINHDQQHNTSCFNVVGPREGVVTAIILITSLLKTQKKLNMETLTIASNDKAFSRGGKILNRESISIRSVSFTRVPPGELSLRKLLVDPLPGSRRVSLLQKPPVHVKSHDRKNKNL